MTRAGALLLLCAASLLITGVKCDDICPALRNMLTGSYREARRCILNKLKYNQNSDVLETADILKSCVDEKLTAEDKQDALSALNKIYSSSLC
ncbi:major allergen I polypeptide chain 1-like [Cervus elaphus]|uniref:major allergen I polypeptide chain 1-like n=1 Tax=Cervus elaphus TaxID=9860 RepID=UPI001CC27B36|nr:major allergen I polypeptide chain 1-like [Cervus elaphus]